MAASPDSQRIEVDADALVELVDVLEQFTGSLHAALKDALGRDRRPALSIVGKDEASD